jgi:hypothetical protein
MAPKSKKKAAQRRVRPREGEAEAMSESQREEGAAAGRAAKELGGQGAVRALVQLADGRLPLRGEEQGDRASDDDKEGLAAAAAAWEQAIEDGPPGAPLDGKLPPRLSSPTGGDEEAVVHC